MVNNFDADALKAEVSLMEKEIIYFTGRKRLRARRKYLQLLRLCGRNCLLNQPIYINRI